MNAKQYWSISTNIVQNSWQVCVWIVKLKHIKSENGSALFCIQSTLPARLLKWDFWRWREKVTESGTSFFLSKTPVTISDWQLHCHYTGIYIIRPVIIGLIIRIENVGHRSSFSCCRSFCTWRLEFYLEIRFVSYIYLKTTSFSWTPQNFNLYCLLFQDWNYFEVFSWKNTFSLLLPSVFF